MAYGTTETNTDKPEIKKPSKKELLEQLKACYKLVSETEAQQRIRETEDLQFQVAEFQWSEEAKKARRGGVVGGQVIPPRPMLSVSLINQPMALIRNQAQSAHLGVEIHPVNETSTRDTAEAQQGLYRRIERDSDANDARIWALDRAVQCGRGYYRVNTQWDEDGDDDSDQEIVIERIYDQSMVYIDPASVKADRSDMQWAIVAAWVPIETFKISYPNVKIPSEDAEFNDWQRSEPQWVRQDGEKKAVLVAEYFYKVPQADDGTVKHNPAKDPVLWCKATCNDILEEQEWNGNYIPIIEVVGRELQPFDAERRLEGIVRGARDGQMFANYSASGIVEALSLEPKAPFVGAEGQFEGHEDQWQQANTRNFPYLEYKPTNIGGELAPPPQRAQVDSSKLMLSIQAFEMAKQLVQSATAIYEPSLGEKPRDQNAQSGRAILALQQQADAGTGHFIQNLARSIRYEARVIRSMFPRVYDRRGRVVQVLGMEDEEKMVMLGRPFVKDPNTGRPIPAPRMNGQQAPNAKIIDLDAGKYSISVNVGKSYQTRLQEGQEAIGSILQAHPEMVPILGATWARFAEFPGHMELAEILKKVRDKQIGPIDNEEQGSPEQMAQQLEAAKQQIQMLTQQLQMAAKALETDQAKQQATIQKAQMDSATTAQKTQADNATKELVARIQQETQIAIATMQAQVQAMQAQLDKAHENRMAAQDRMHATSERMGGQFHEDSQRAAGEAHEAGQAGADRRFQSSERAAGETHEAAMTELSRDIPAGPKTAS